MDALAKRLAVLERKALEEGDALLGATYDAISHARRLNEAEDAVEDFRAEMKVVQQKFGSSRS